MHYINHYFDMCNTRSFAIAPAALPSTLLKIALPVCNLSNPASPICPLPRVDNCSFCLKYSEFLLLSISIPDSKFRDSKVGNSFIGLLGTSFEEDHSSSGSLRLTWPNIGSSLLQNCHLWGYAIQWISLVREKRATIGTNTFQRIKFLSTQTKKALTHYQDYPKNLVRVIM